MSYYVHCTPYTHSQCVGASFQINHLKRPLKTKLFTPFRDPRVETLEQGAAQVLIFPNFSLCSKLSYPPESIIPLVNKKFVGQEKIALYLLLKRFFWSSTSLDWTTKSRRESEETSSFFCIFRDKIHYLHFVADVVIWA